MLTTCPKCSHTFSHNHQLEPCYVNQPPPRTFTGGGLSVSLHLPPSGSTTVAITASKESPSVTVTAVSSHRVLAAMAGGGIILQSTGDAASKSPSTPLSFVLPSPTPSAPAPPWTAAPQSDTDLERLAGTVAALRTSGWYYEGLSWQESADLLRPTVPGTFLVRDSSDPRFLFSLSVQTDRGPMSVRLHYVCGQFRFDADSRLAGRMPLFDCVVKLVEHYIAATKDSGRKRKDQVWVDASGQMYSHILLRTPLYNKSRLPTLQHLARLAISRRACQSVSVLPLPETLKTYLREYPYTH